MYKIKVSLPNEKNNLNIKDFVNNENNTYKNFKFYINEDIEEVDYWFVVENVIQNHEETKVNKENIVYLNYETSYPKDYFLTKCMKSYLSQFSKKYGCYNDFTDNYFSSPPFQPWLINSSQNSSLESNSKRDYEYLTKLSGVEKTKNLSIICSTKKVTDDHAARLKFVETLEKHFNNNLDWYGTGKKKIEQKWEGISKYKYHIVLENESRNNLISEKLYDSYLGLSYPFYFGAPNLSEFFPKDSFSFIDIFNISESIEIIRNGIENNLYEEHFDKLLKSKNIVLNKFNLFKRMITIIEESPNENLSLKKTKNKIYSVGYFWKKDVGFKDKTKHHIKRKLRLNVRNY